MMIQDKNVRNVLSMARQDLCFSIQFGLTDKNTIYAHRIFSSVLAITRLLGDRLDFIDQMKSWDMECPDCNTYLGGAK